MASSRLNLQMEEIQSIYTTEMFIGLQRMRERGTLCDAVLICDRTEFPVHRVVMSVGSPYFKGLLTQAGNLPSRIELPGVVEPDALKIILKFLYSGSIQDLGERAGLLPALLRAAEFFQISIIYDYCWNTAMTNLTTQTFAEVWCLADASGDKKMVPSLMAFALPNLSTIIETGGFLMLAVGQLRPLLEQLKLRQQSTDLIIRGILSWVNANAPERQRHLGALIAIVDLRLLSNHYLKTLVRDVDILKTLPETYNNLVTIAMDRLHLESSHSFQNLLMISFNYNDREPSEERQCSLETQTWLTKKRFPATLEYGTAAAYLHGYVYFFGGGHEPSEASDLVTVYNIEQSSVVFILKMNYRRFRPGVAVFQNQLYVVGGANVSGNLRSVERYDPAINTWFPVGSTSIAHSCPNVVAVRNGLYVVGSWNCGIVERYSTATDSWTTISTIPGPIGGGHHIWPTVATCLGNIYVVSSVNEQKFHVFDSLLERWSVIPFGTATGITVRDIWHVTNGTDDKPFIFALTWENQIFSFNCQQAKFQRCLAVPPDFAVKRVLTFFATL